MLYKLARGNFIVAVMLYWAILVLATLILYPVSLIGVAFVVYRWVLSLRQPPTTLGSARVSTHDEIREAGMIGAERGPVIGVLPKNVRRAWSYRRRMLFRSKRAKAACNGFLARHVRKEQLSSQLVRLPKAVMTAIFAKTRAGKAQGSILATLCHGCDDGASKVIIDWKSEYVKLAPMFRKRGYKVIILYYYGASGLPTNCWNPFDVVKDGDPHAIEKLRTLFECCIDRKHQVESYWNDSGKNVNCAVASLVCHYGKNIDRSIAKVDAIVTDPQALADAVELMCQPDASGEYPFNGMLQRMAGGIKHLVDREKGSVLSNAQKMLIPFRFAEMVKHSVASDCDLSKLTDEKTVVFIVPSLEFAADMLPWVKVVLGACIMGVMAGPLQEKRLVTFYLDEASALGPMEIVRHALERGAAYGVRLVFVYQGIGQVQDCWPNGSWKTFLAQVTQIHFAVSDLDTAKYISEYIGPETVFTQNSGGNTGWNKSGQTRDTQSYSGGQSWGMNETSRPKLYPSEILALSDRTCITLGYLPYPIVTELLMAYEHNWLVKPPGFIRRLLGSVMMLWLSLWVLLSAAVVAGALVMYGNETGAFKRVEREVQILLKRTGL